MRRVKLGYSIGSLHKYSSWAGVDLCRVPLWQIISAREGVQLVLCCYVLKMELTRRANSQIWHEWWLGGFWNYPTHPFSAHCQLNSQWDICSKLVTHKCVCVCFLKVKVIDKWIDRLIFSFVKVKERRKKQIFLSNKRLFLQNGVGKIFLRFEVFQIILKKINK